MKRTLQIIALALSLMTACSLFGCADDPATGETELTKGFLNTSATDDAGRSFQPVSGYDDEKYVGIFYFLWNGSDQSPIKDVSNNYEKNHTVMSELLARAAAGGTPEMNSFHYWGEPLYGYYNADDEWVIRKHIELFIHAGLDFIAFDTSNARIYDVQVYTFLDLLLEYAAMGYRVPQVLFMTPVDVGPSKTTVQSIYDSFYDPELYAQYDGLWFRGNRAKPWIIGSETGNSAVDSYFYFKLPQWPNAAIEKSRFPWMDWNYPQDTYTDSQAGNVMSVSVSQHVGLMGKSNGLYADFSDSGLFAPENRGELVKNGFSFDTNYIEKVYNANWGRGYDQKTGENDRGRALTECTNFEQQWETVLNLKEDSDPNNDIGLVFVTGWNEWIAQKQANSTILGQDYCHFVDTFNMEFSRDIEMSGEYLDNYYLSLVRNVRAYKGEGEGDVFADASQSQSSLMTSYKGWNDAEAVYCDFAGETIARNAVDTSGQVSLVNDTGRNDIREIKVKSDGDTLYFMITTAEKITAREAGDARWMNLYLGTAGASGGWQNFQYVLNRESDKDTASVHRIENNSFVRSGECELKIDGNRMRIAVKKSALGITGGEYTLYIKAADNLQKDLDIADLYVSGDAAPIGRLGYTYAVRNK